MNYIKTIFLKDIWSLMIVPTGAIVASLFALTCSIVFVAQVLHPGSIATMRPVFDFAAWLILFLCPAITMRLIAEERRVGTWELLLSSPASSFEITKGKFLAAFAFMGVVLATTFPLVFVLFFAGVGAICLLGFDLNRCLAKEHTYIFVVVFS